MERAPWPAVLVTSSPTAPRGGRHGTARRWRLVVAATATLLATSACTGEGPEQGADPGTPADTDTGTADDEGAAADGGADPALPDVATVDPDEVDPDAAGGGIDAAVASAAADLPDGWDATVIADPVLGPYVVGLPTGATVWRVGDDLDPLRDAAAGTAWLRYWEPILTEASAATDSSSLRAAVVLPADDRDAAHHLTVTATPLQDLPADDPAALAERFAATFEDQGLTVEDVGTAAAGDREVGGVTLTTPDDEFDDGVPRRLLQWFYPEPAAPVLWSVTCEGPAPDADAVDAACTPLLASFRTPPR